MALHFNSLIDRRLAALFLAPVQAPHRRVLPAQESGRPLAPVMVGSCGELGSRALSWAQWDSSVPTTPCRVHCPCCCA